MAGDVTGRLVWEVVEGAGGLKGLVGWAGVGGRLRWARVLVLLRGSRSVGRLRKRLLLIAPMFGWV